MSDKPIGDLRRRKIADMTIRTFADKAQRDISGILRPSLASRPLARHCDRRRHPPLQFARVERADDYKRRLC
jgi:hypothetical protein